jgi:hypothetical protein
MFGGRLVVLCVAGVDLWERLKGLVVKKTMA